MIGKNTLRTTLIGLFLVTVLLALVPAVQTAMKGEYRGIPPAYVDDDTYYYARMKEVSDGKPFIGNPYFIEYRDARAVAFFVADWLAAVPLFLGLPFSFVIVLNMVLWSVLFVFLAYRIGRAADVPIPYAALAALVAYVEVYWVVFRPVVMQEVFPFFLLFLLAFFSWLRYPLRRRSVIFLAIAGAAPFYIYTYLWQVIFAVLGVVFAHRVIQKKWAEVKALSRVALGTALLALPAIVYTAYQIRDPFYWETVNRIGLLESFLPTWDVYLYGRWVVLLSLLSLCVYRWLKTPPESAEGDGGMRGVLPVIAYSGIGLLLISASNAVTGKDMATAEHIGRFITLWIGLFFPMMAWRMWVGRRDLLRLPWPKLIALGVLVLGCLGFLGSNLKRALPFQRIASVDAQIVQGYAAPLTWLQERESEPMTVWANESISMYVPILTRHYVFWTNVGGLQLMPSTEVEDRFLASQIRLLTAEEIFASYERFEGSGIGRRYEDYMHKNRLHCLIEDSCTPPKSLTEWIGPAKVEALMKRQRELKKNIGRVMDTYHVAYLIADTAKGEEKYFGSLPGAVRVWNDERFVIYELR